MSKSDERPRWLSHGFETDRLFGCTGFVLIGRLAFAADRVPVETRAAENPSPSRSPPGEWRESPQAATPDLWRCDGARATRTERNSRNRASAHACPRGGTSDAGRPTDRVEQ